MSVRLSVLQMRKLSLKKLNQLSLSCRVTGTRLYSREAPVLTQGATLRLLKDMFVERLLE